MKIKIIKSKGKTKTYLVFDNDKLETYYLFMDAEKTSLPLPKRFKKYLDNARYKAKVCANKDEVAVRVKAKEALVAMAKLCNILCEKTDDLSDENKQLCNAIKIKNGVINDLNGLIEDDNVVSESEKLAEERLKFEKEREFFYREKEAWEASRKNASVTSVYKTEENIEPQKVEPEITE